MFLTEQCRLGKGWVYMGRLLPRLACGVLCSQRQPSDHVGVLTGYCFGKHISWAVLCANTNQAAAVTMCFSYGLLTRTCLHLCSALRMYVLCVPCSTTVASVPTTKTSCWSAHTAQECGSVTTTARAAARAGQTCARWDLSMLH